MLTDGTVRVTNADGSAVYAGKAGENWVDGAVQWHEVLNVGETTASSLVVEKKY